MDPPLQFNQVELINYINPNGEAISQSISEFVDNLPHDVATATTPQVAVDAAPEAAAVDYVPQVDVDDLVSAPMPLLSNNYVRVVGEHAHVQRTFFFMPEVMNLWPLHQNDLVGMVERRLSRLYASGEDDMHDKRASLNYLRWALTNKRAIQELKNRLLFVVKCLADEKHCLTQRREAISRSYFFSELQ